MSRPAVLAIDEGTTNCKAILVAHDGEILASGASPLPIAYPQSGWVQQDATEIWNATREAIAGCLSKAPDVEPVAVGISNQRESILIWDRQTGEPLGPVVTWQCRRTAAACEQLKQAGYEAEVIARTGLPLDPLFPPTKVAWLLQRHTGARADVCIGTVDSWLIWKLTDRALHATDHANAARTQLYNLSDGRWDPWLCALFEIDAAMLPQIRDSSAVFGTTRNAGVIGDGVPIASAIGDSHAALFGHGAAARGDCKITFGTGSSLMTTIPEFQLPPTGITTTVAWSIGGTRTFAFEGNILVSASILPWTADMLGLDGVDTLLQRAQAASSSNGVDIVPAHVGLGSPHWQAEARGLICGLSFDTKPDHIAYAAAESIALQAYDVFTIMAAAAGGIGRLSVDGGPSSNPFLMQIVADLLDHTVTPCLHSEVSALGAAHLAGLATGFWADLDAIAKLSRRGEPISPRMEPAQRERRLSDWKAAIGRTIATLE